MRFKKKYYALGHEIKVEFKDRVILETDKTERCGLWTPDKNLIQIANGLNPDLRTETFLHEMCHANADINDIRLSEEAIQKMTLFWLSLLRDKRNNLDLRRK